MRLVRWQLHLMGWRKTFVLSFQMQMSLQLQLAVQAEELSASSEESLAASEMVAEITEKNLFGSESQVAIVNETVLAIGEVVTGINRITEDNEAMLLSSEDVARLVEEGASLMEDVNGQMTVISSAIGQSAEIMSGMANYSEEIRKVTSLNYRYC